MTTKIEVGDVLRHESGNEYTVVFMGETHGVAKVTKLAVHSHLAVNQNAEMSFHANIVTSSMWEHQKSLPLVKTAYFLIIKDDPEDDPVDSLDGYLEEADFDEAHENMRLYPHRYKGVIRLNPDQTWDYVDVNDEVITA